MKNIIRLLSAINKPFKRYLFFIIPLLIIVLNLYEMIYFNLENDSGMRLNITGIILAVFLTILYLALGKEELFCVAAIITFFCYSLVSLVFALIEEVTAIIAVPLLAVVAVMFIITMIVWGSSMKKKFHERFNKKK